MCWVEPERLAESKGVVLVVLDGLRSELEAGILAERSQQEEGVLRLDAELFDFNFVGGVDAVAEEKSPHIGWCFLFGSEK